MTDKPTTADENSPTFLLRALLLTQKGYLDKLVKILENEQNPPPMWGADVVRITIPMLVGIGASVHSVFRFTEGQDMAIRDVYGIARCLSELAVNACYIAASGRETALQAERHAFQKHYRNLDRKEHIGGLHFNVRHTGKREVDEIPGMAEALEEFSTKKGHEIKEWTRESITSRIDKVIEIDLGAAMCLGQSIFSLYRHSSDVLHGSYFGVHYFWCGSDGVSITKRPFSDVWNEHFKKIFGATFFATQGVIRLYAALLNIPKLAQAQIDAMNYFEEHSKKHSPPIEGYGWTATPFSQEN